MTEPMAANGRGNMRPASRSPPFLAVGLFVALVILAFNYWSLSGRNHEQSNEIVLLESELRLVNAKKTSAEKRGEAITEKFSEVERQLNEQKELSARNQAELANVAREKQSLIDRTNELENEVRLIKEQQLPTCETEKKNLQQEVEQLRADIEVHKNKECGKSDCEKFVLKERDATVEDMYKVVGAPPLISMLRSNVNLGSYKDQVSRLATQMDQEALKKQQQADYQQQHQPLDNQQLQQQQQPLDTQQQQQQQPSDTQQQQQQQPLDTQQQQQQQQQPLDTQQQQAVDTQLQQQQQVDVQQQQQPAQIDPLHQQAQVDTQGQQVPVGYDQQQQQQPDGQQAADTGAQQSNLNVETGQGVAPVPDFGQGNVVETRQEASNLQEGDTAKAVNEDNPLLDEQRPDRDEGLEIGANKQYDDIHDDYDDDEEDDLKDALNVNEKTKDIKKEEDGIETMFQRDRDAAVQAH